MVISSIHMDSHVRANTKATLQIYTEVDSKWCVGISRSARVDGESSVIKYWYKVCTEMPKRLSHYDTRLAFPLTSAFLHSSFRCLQNRIPHTAQLSQSRLPFFS